jgi:hypothetical protein
VPANVGKATATTPPVHPPRIEAPAAADKHKIAAVPAARVVVAEQPGTFWPSPFLIVVLLGLIAGGVAWHVQAPRPGTTEAGQYMAAFGTAGSEPSPRGTPRGGIKSKGEIMARPSGGVPAPREVGFPSQEDWARRAAKVRNPVSGFFFGVGARSNAQALEDEHQRMKSARAVIKEYVGMYSDLREGEEAAAAYAVRRNLASEHLEHERATQREVFDEAAHRRQLAQKRRKKELTESETHLIEAQHEQQALERFKETKFQAGLARFEEKVKGYLVGAASADAAIAETKAPAKPESGANESEEVVKLYALLQSTMAAIEEGERLGRDTQALRERAELYKKLLNLA